MVFNHKLSVKKPHTGNQESQAILKPTYSRYIIGLQGQAGEQKCLSGHYQAYTTMK
jgi:hypothetical protein